MDFDGRDKVIAFDTLFCTNHIQMLKIMLPYMDNSIQKTLAVYIKLLELNYTISFYHKNPGSLCGCIQQKSSPDFKELCTELLPYCSEKEKKQLEQMRSLFQGMEMYQEMARTMELMKEFMPDADLFSAFGSEGQKSDNTAAGGFDMMSMLMNMLTPEQKEMFEMFGGNHGE